MYKLVMAQMLCPQKGVYGLALQEAYGVLLKVSWSTRITVASGRHRARCGPGPPRKEGRLLQAGHLGPGPSQPGEGQEGEGEAGGGQAATAARGLWHIALFQVTIVRIVAVAHHSIAADLALARALCRPRHLRLVP
jgi:hypothetical protein